MKKCMWSWLGTLGLLVLLLTAFGQTAYAQLVPPAGTVRITNLQAVGSGCPPGSAVASVSPDRQSFTIAYSQYTAEVGPGVPRIEARKNCGVILNVQYPVGFTISIVSVDYRGFADLDDDTVGTVAGQYFFMGQFPQVEFEEPIFGPAFDNYEIRDLFLTGVFQLSCRQRRALIINNEVRVQARSGQGGLMTADNTTGTFQETFGIVWRRCP
jgi:hypothetical protein